MPEPIKPARIVIPDEVKASIKLQEEQLAHIKIIRDETKALGESVDELNKQIAIAELILKSAKEVIARSEAP